ncbi:hypothetical protein JZ751_015353 [Albula glossodonta]|uniref:Uncharacterized protein n=1 Tax=Albula glossodonta TaxID=121402 RepID=A0A8T2MXM7_9TELE|nr:hypothetical protein JZ751_015353 [Albula glossodonta]
MFQAWSRSPRLHCVRVLQLTPFNYHLALTGSRSEKGAGPQRQAEERGTNLPLGGRGAPSKTAFHTKYFDFLLDLKLKRISARKWEHGCDKWDGWAMAEVRWGGLPLTVEWGEGVGGGGRGNVRCACRDGVRAKPHAGEQCTHRVFPSPGNALPLPLPRRAMRTSSPICSVSLKAKFFKRFKGVTADLGQEKPDLRTVLSFRAGSCLPAAVSFNCWSATPPSPPPCPQTHLSHVLVFVLDWSSRPQVNVAVTASLGIVLATPVCCERLTYAADGLDIFVSSVAVRDGCHWGRLDDCHSQDEAREQFSSLPKEWTREYVELKAAQKRTVCEASEALGVIWSGGAGGGVVPWRWGGGGGGGEEAGSLCLINRIPGPCLDTPGRFGLLNGEQGVDMRVTISAPAHPGVPVWSFLYGLGVGTGDGLSGITASHRLFCAEAVLCFSDVVVVVLC